jgi:small-conductance mechanosensitive channel
MDFNAILKFINDVLHYHLFELNKTWITPSSIVMFIVVIAVFFLISKVLRATILDGILGRFQIDQGTKYNLNRVIHYLIMITGAIVSFQFIGLDLTGLAFVFGLLSVGIGFGLQNIASNFVSGLILLFERPIKIGDRVTVGDTEGDVIAINMRSTTIRSLKNISIIVPNSDFISSQVINWSHGDPTVRLDIEVGVSYNSDLDTVIRCLKEVASENSQILSKPKPEVYFTSFGDSSWNMKLLVWLNDPYRYYSTRSDINCAIVKKFRENNVEIPFPQRDLHVRSPLPVPLSKETN